MGMTRINRHIAERLVGADACNDLRQRRVTEVLLATGAKLVLITQGAVRRFAIHGYAQDGSDRNLAALV